MAQIRRRSFIQGAVGVGLAGLPQARAQPPKQATQTDNLCFASVAELSSLLANGAVKSEEIAASIIERQKTVNATLNAVSTAIPEDVIQASAKAADRRRASGKTRSAIDGIPFTTKDNVETENIVTTNGCPELRSYRPKQDATLVKRLKNAGAIMLGKTNVPEMCMAGETDNVIFGRTRNPYALDRVPGGSSGGEAAIIAAGGSPFGVGTDIGGSIRQPSHCCGIAGIKPTTGRVPDTGVFNSFHPSVWRWNGIGPMARSVKDLSLILEIISGPDGTDPKATNSSLRRYDEARVEKLRILALESDGFTEPIAQVTSTINDASATLAASCQAVQKTVLPFLHEGFDRWVFTQIPTWATAIREFRKRYADLGNSPLVTEHHFQVEWLLKAIDEWEGRFEEGRAFEEQLELRKFQQKMVRSTREFDVIITPVSNGPASKPTTEADYDGLSADNHNDFKQQGFFTHPFNILGWPAVVVRCGTSEEGLPLGLQIVARPWREDLALAVAAILEREFGGWVAPNV